MTSASERRTGQIDGPRGRRFVEVEDWARLPEGWSLCDVPGVTVGPDDRPAGPIQFVAPHGIAVDRSGNLYVGEVRQAAGADAAGWHKAVRKLARIA